MLVSFFVPGGAAKGGWTSYTPLADIADKGPGYDVIFNGQTLWLIGFILLITSSLLGAINFIATIIQLRAKGMTWMRLPFFVWAQFVTAFLLLLAFPPLESAIVMQLMDRVAGTSFFLPSGLVVNGTAVSISGGGSPLLWQHLFWFLGHPEVYVLILPGMGIVAEVIANNTRKPLWGYKSLVLAALVLGFLSFIVWAHHMWLTGMGTAVSAFFQTTTMIISIPSVIILSAFFISLWGGSIRFTVPMLFATAFLPMFGIGGLTGIPLAFNSADLYLHDTYYVIAHFHYIVAPGTIFAVFAGIYYWFPEGDRAKDERLLGEGAFLAVAHLHERDFSADVPAGDARDASPLVRWRRGLDARFGEGLGPERFPLEPADLDRRLDDGPRADSVHHQFLLEHAARSKSRRSIRGRRPPWSGPRRRRRRTAISSPRQSSIAGPTNTACRAGRRISRCKPNRLSLTNGRRTNQPCRLAIRRRHLPPA